MWYCAIHQGVPLFETIVAVNGNKPVEGERRLQIQAIKTGRAFILKSPLLRIAFESCSNVLLDTMNDFQIDIKSDGELCTKIGRIRHLRSVKWHQTNHII